MNVTKFDKPVLRAISADITEALKTVSQKYGVQFSYKGCSFADTNATFRIEGSVVSTSGIVETKEREDYRRNCELLQLKAEWLDETFSFGGKNLKIVGLCVRRSKNPVLVEDVDTKKKFVYPDSTVRLLMEAKTPKVPVAA